MSGRLQETEPSSPRLVITGGEGDLAAAIRSRFLDEGWDVHAPGRGELDVTDPAAVTAWFRDTGRIDLLVLNAGCVDDSLLARMTEAQWDHVIDTNLKGAFLCLKAALRQLLRASGGGHVVAIGSFSARNGPAGQTAYAAAKAGLTGLIQSAATEYGGRGLRANVILPGFLETKMTSHLPPETKEAFRQAHTLGRFNTPGDVARFLSMLHELKAVSGQVFSLDSRISRWT
jgi:3-oxoacyl-[acyl-carrier protein] reductase